MKTIKTTIALTLALATMTFIGCKEEEPDPSLVNFDQASYNITTDDLSPFDVNLTIDPAAAEASEIVIEFEGATPGTEFNTTPAASGSTLTLPVAIGDTEASFSFEGDAEGIGFDNVTVDMTISSVGAGLTTGLTTESTVAITNTLDTGTDLPYFASFDSCAAVIEENKKFPDGWEAIVAEQNSQGTAGWKCVPRDNGSAASNPFFDCGDTSSDPSEVWLVSPRLNLTDATAPTLTFDGDLRFGPFDIQDYDVKISTDYNGDNFESSTWTTIDEANTGFAAIDRGVDGLETIGPIDLSEYSGNVVAVAFIHIQPGVGCGTSGAMRVKNFSVE